MKIYASVDMEGIAGIVVREQLRRGELLYEEARRLLTQEVNVLVESLVAEGATEIIIKDAHGTGFNLLVEQLHPGACYALGATRTEQRFPGLDESFDGALLIGYHAAAGTQHAVRDHTFVPTDWQSLTLNGTRVGEIALDALLFGARGVPILLVSGDDKACAEAHACFDAVQTYQTKVGYGKHAALVTPPAAIYPQIRAAVQRALQLIGRAQPFTKPGPYRLEMCYASTDLLDARYFDGKRDFRADGVTAVFQDTDLLRLLARAL